MRMPKMPKGIKFVPIPDHEYNEDGCITPPPALGRKNPVWTEERREKQRQAIRRWKPWRGSTGPRTIPGKMRSAMNALRHGRRGAQVRRFDALMRHQQNFLKLVQAQADHYIFWPNELLDFARTPPRQDPERAQKDNYLRIWRQFMLSLGLEEP